MTPSAPTTTALCCICLTRPAARPVLTPHVLDGFPFLECSLDCDKILVLGIFGIFLCQFPGRSHRHAPAAASSHFQCLPSKDLGFSAVRSISSMQRALTSILSGSERGT